MLLRRVHARWVVHPAMLWNPAQRATVPRRHKMKRHERYLWQMRYGIRSKQRYETPALLDAEFRHPPGWHRGRHPYPLSADTC